MWLKEKEIVVLSYEEAKRLLGFISARDAISLMPLWEVMRIARVM